MTRLTRLIEKGDIVDVVWNDESLYLDAKVLYMPQSTGDLLYVKTSIGNIVGINTASSSFDCIVLKVVNQND